jgi:hypothetical protein
MTGEGRSAFPRVGALAVARVLALALASACAPAARPLTGAAAPATAIPRTAVLQAPTQVGFRWEFREEQLAIRGEGAARLAPPDSARLDLFLDGGFGSGNAFVFGDTVRARIPMGDRLIPPAALFWGAVGRLAVPPGDTAVRVVGDTVRADITGARGTFRASFVRDSLVQLERIVDGRVVERVDRTGPVVRYRQLASRRALDLTILRRAAVAPFDAAIWSR